jgi:hypothetical protein
MTAPNREDVRDALCTLLGTIAGTGKTLYEVINGDPGDQLKGQTPVVSVMSAGSARPNMIRGTAQGNNEFRLAVITWVSADTTSPDDVLDGIEREITDLIADPDNRTAEAGSVVAGKWVHIRFEDGFSEVTQSRPLSGNVYLMEIRYVIVTAW